MYGNAFVRNLGTLRSQPDAVEYMVAVRLDDDLHTIRSAACQELPERRLAARMKMCLWVLQQQQCALDRKSTRLNSSH